MDDKPTKTDAVEKNDTAAGEGAEKARPSAGPHARDDLTNADATPGAGSLPDENATGDADGGTG